ncbi:MAG: preprotein translocase subunit SecE [Sphingomonadales bacterium]
MARTNPALFMKQVKTEVSKVVTPSRKETFVTTAMVFIMVVLASLFFLVVDMGFAQAVKLILPNHG